MLVVVSIPALYLIQQWLPPAEWLGLAFRPGSLADGGWWPGVLTAMFLHAGWAHVGMNAAGALAFAPPVARLFPRLRGGAAFLLFYMACGVAAALGYGLVHMNSQDIMVGASGAVFGLTGAAIRLLGRKNGRLRSLTDRRVVTTGLALMGVNALIGLIGFAPGAEGLQIAWEAHAFGFVFGLLAIGPWMKVFGRRAPAFDSSADLRDPPV